MEVLQFFLYNFATTCCPVEISYLKVTSVVLSTLKSAAMLLKVTSHACDKGILN